MNRNAAALLNEALAWPTEDGVTVARRARRLGWRDDDNGSAVWTTEIKRRIRELDEGAVATISGLKCAFVSLSEQLLPLPTQLQDGPLPTKAWRSSEPHGRNFSPNIPVVAAESETRAIEVVYFQ
jgi:hypothetical protein